MLQLDCDCCCISAYFFYLSCNDLPCSDGKQGNKLSVICFMRCQSPAPVGTVFGFQCFTLFLFIYVHSNCLCAIINRLNSKYVKDVSMKIFYNEPTVACTNFFNFQLILNPRRFVSTIEILTKNSCIQISKISKKLQLNQICHIVYVAVFVRELFCV